MNGKSVYLDSSAIAKRYLAEDGSETVDALYRRAEAREVRLAFSLWNVGEVARAIAKAERLRWISKKQAGAATWAFLRESLKLRDLGVLRTIPVRGDLLAKALTLLLREGIGQADGLQIATCKEFGASALVSADRRLLEVARSEGLAALDPVGDGPRIRSI